MDSNKGDVDDKENVFKVPTLPDEDRKKAAILKKLERRRTANITKWEKRKSTTSPVIDLEETEKSFLQQTFVEPPRPSFSDISTIYPSDTFIVSPRANPAGPICSTPFRAKQNIQIQKPPSPFTVKEQHCDGQNEIAGRQFKALSVWCNMLLNTCNRFEEGIVDLGKTKQDAFLCLQELLKNQKKTSNEEERKFKVHEFIKGQQFYSIRNKAMKVYHENDVPNKIATMIQKDMVTIRDEINVYSDISLKAKLLRVLISFNPVWLHLGMETVFGVGIEIPDGISFLSVMTHFINFHVFSDPTLWKKYAIGTAKVFVNAEARQPLHRHFLIKVCQFLYCVEQCKLKRVIASDPRLFIRNSTLKSLKDVFAELSREVLSASCLTLNKAFLKVGFKTTYEQSYFDDLEYCITTYSDLADGTHLGKLLEIVCSLGRGTIMNKLRNPGGDRLRKVGNVTVVIDVAVKAGLDVAHLKPDAIVGGQKDSILEFLWKIVGKPATVIQCFVRRFLAVRRLQKLREAKHRAAYEEKVVLIQALIRRFLVQKRKQKYREEKAEYERQVIVIQAAIRRFLAMKKVQQYRDEANEFERKVVIIQAAIRRFLAKKKFQNLRNEAVEYIYKAAIRRFLAMKKLQQYRDEANEFERKVVIIQAAIRRFLATNRLERYRKDVVEKERNVILIQSFTRRYLAMKKLKHLRSEKERKFHELRCRSAVILQRFFRQILERRRYQKWHKEMVLQQLEEAKKQQDELEQCVIRIQTTVRRFLARREYEKLKQNIVAKGDFERSVVCLQAYVRGYVTRKRINERTIKEIVSLKEENCDVFISDGCTPITSKSVSRLRISEQLLPTTPELMRKLRKLRDEIITVKTRNSMHEQVIESLKWVYKEPNIAEKTAAALIIQKCWRGYCVRRDYREHIHRRYKVMQQYIESIENHDHTYCEEVKSRPVMSRLAEWADMLFNQSLYRAKVAAISIGRVIKLSPFLCQHFVIECRGFLAILDRIEQADRSPGQEEIVSSLVASFSCIVEHANIDTGIRQIIMDYNQDSLKNLFHVFNAFYNNVEIIKNSVTAIIGILELSSEIKYEKASYFIKQAEKRYTRLAEADPRRVSVTILKQYCSFMSNV